jgi:hypothetical protein
MLLHTIWHNQHDSPQNARKLIALYEVRLAVALA